MQYHILMAILEAALEEPRPLTLSELSATVRALGVATPREAVGDLRIDRDAR